MSRASATARLTFKQHRFGLVGMGLILLGIAASAAAFALFIGSLGLADCATVTTASCLAAGERLAGVNTPLSLIRAGALPVAVIAGVFLGVPIVASEIEDGTASIPWTLSRSRARWLMARVLIIGAVLLTLTACVGLALDGVQQALAPQVPITANLATYEGRGWLVPVRATVGFACGVFAGAALGRSLSGLLMGSVIAVALVGGVIPIGDAWNRTNEQDVTGDQGAIDLDLGLRDHTTGRVLTYEQGEAILPPADPLFNEQFEEVRLGVPGDQSSLVIGREVAIHGLEVLVLLGSAFAIVDRRRPY